MSELDNSAYNSNITYAESVQNGNMSEKPNESVYMVTENDSQD